MQIKTLAIAALAAAALASPAAALTIVQAKTFDALASGAVTAFTLDQFDSSLGALDSVTLDFTFLMPEVSGSVKNTGRSARDFTVNGSASGSVVGQGFNLSGASPVVSKTLVNLAANATSGVGPFSGSGGSTATLVGDLSAFVGGGALAYTFTRGASFQLVPSGQGTLTISPAVSGTATLTYNYTAPPPPPTNTPVPEPATWALMITGFGGMGAMMRRRRLALARA